MISIRNQSKIISNTITISTWFIWNDESCEIFLTRHDERRNIFDISEIRKLILYIFLLGWTESIKRSMSFYQSLLLSFLLSSEVKGSQRGIVRDSWSAIITNEEIQVLQDITKLQREYKMMKQNDRNERRR